MVGVSSSGVGVMIWGSFRGGFCYVWGGLGLVGSGRSGHRERPCLLFPGTLALREKRSGTRILFHPFGFTKSSTGGFLYPWKE